MFWPPYGFVQFSGETYHLSSEMLTFNGLYFLKGTTNIDCSKDSDQTSAYYLSEKVLKIGIIKFTYRKYYKIYNHT